MYTAPVPILKDFHMSQIKYIRLDKISPPNFDTRITSDPESDDELRDSIRELGVLEPILVEDTSEGIKIIAGHRRYKEAGRAGLAAIPCIIIDVTGSQADKIKLHENLKRLPLGHVDQAYTFAHLIKEYKMTEQQIADLCNKSIGYVSQHLSLLHCDKDFLASVHGGRINFSIARELLQCRDLDDRKRLREIIEENGATVSVVRSWVNESNRETDNIRGEIEHHTPVSRPGDSQLPMYPCTACGVAIDISEIKVARLCPDCHYLIFSEIEKEKFKLRSGTDQNPP